jgi:hypothetical protein
MTSVSALVLTVPDRGAWPSL